MASYAIGDVQGCFDELQALLRQINFNSDRDQLWFCGDLVNRGPKSLETLRFIKALEDNAISVLGNHDLHLLATFYNNKKPSRKDTFDELLAADDLNMLLHWLRQRPLLHYDEEHNVTLVHAGIPPQWSISKARQLATEMAQLLQGDNHVNFYKHMYGDKPFIWHETLSGWQRYRFITNMLTRLRYCDIDGKPALSAKGPPGSQAQHLFPWYEIPDRESQSDTIIFGHWSTLPHAGISNINNAYAIDSGCLWGGALTAMRIDVRPFEYFQLPCAGTLKPPEKYLKQLNLRNKNSK